MQDSLKKKTIQLLTEFTITIQCGGPNGCTLNVYQDGYHEFVHYIYKEIDGNIRFATSRSNEHELNDSTFFDPVMTDKRIDASLLLTSLMNIEEVEQFINDSDKPKLFEAKYWCVPIFLVAVGLVFGLIKLYFGSN